MRELQVTMFGALRFLYVGSSDTLRDLAYYRDVLGAEVLWNLTGFGARVAAVRLGEGPLVLLADHRPPKSVLPVWQVASLAATKRALAARGWTAAHEVEIPNGPCAVFADPTGNEVAVFEETRPGVDERFRAESGL